MDTIETIKNDTRAIVHLKEDEERAAATLTRLVMYQVTLPSDSSKYSPSGDYVRFNAQDDNELHGWFKIESIVIDEILEELVEEQKEASNG